MRTILKVKMRSYFAIIAAVAAASACEAPSKSAVSTAQASVAESKVSAPNDGIIPGTPPGDLGDWVKDIRKGIATVPGLIQKDPAAAQRTTLDLYVTRQEYAEMYYGLEGRINTNSELAQAIELAEKRFHELMKLVGTAKPSRTAVESAVDALDSQQALVSKLWKKSGAHINRSARQ